MILVIITIVYYNNLVKGKLKVKNAWSQIDVQLQKRFDLIQNLVEIVKGYEKHESDTLTKLTDIRKSWNTASSVTEKMEMESKSSESIKALFAVAEAYPDLKANHNFLALQNELADVETQITFSRQFFNDTVTMYNTQLQVFPSNIFAMFFGFKEENLFLLDRNAQEDIQLEF